MAAVDPVVRDRRLIRLALGGRTFELAVGHRGAERALTRVLRFLPPARGPATRLDLGAQVRRARGFGEILAAALRGCSVALFPRCLLLHAAVVVAPTGAVMFVGPSGVGKTTIAMMALRLGLPVLADDIACVRVRDRRVLPAPIRLRVREPTAKLLGVARLPPAAEASPLRAIVLLGAGARSLAEVLGAQTLSTELPAERRWELVAQLAHLIEGVPIRRLPRLTLHGPRAARGVERLRSLFAELGVEPRRIARAIRTGPGRASRGSA